MKTLYISDLYSGQIGFGIPFEMGVWVRSIRRHGKVCFVDIKDSTGVIQLVCLLDKLGHDRYRELSLLTPESSLVIQGVLTLNEQSGKIEILATGVRVISIAKAWISPPISGEFDPFDERMADHLLHNRHLYIRNPKLMAVLRFRYLFMNAVRQWFHRNRFMEITAPILTQLPLYDNNSVLEVKVGGNTPVYLTQCVGFYLESAVHAFERVYNIGPSFRGEESRSKRHLMEYWHIKAEAAFGNIEDIISIVESLISEVTMECLQYQSMLDVLGTKLCEDGVKPPYSRISYRETIRILEKAGFPVKFGDNLGSQEEAFLSSQLNGPFWVVGIPRSVEPFPYAINPDDPEVTMTADLIASNGFGELLGVAEKIVDLGMLEERMAEKGKGTDSRYDWVKDTHRFGPVPHIAFGMGVERMLRWLLNIPHVRDTIPFPRTFNRRVYP